MKLAVLRNPKLRRLMTATGMTRPEAVGTLELLWLFAMEQTPSGDVGRWEDMDIEAELDWRGESGALVSALVKSGWLDRCPTHRLVIHDWADHIPEYLQKRVDRGTLKLAKSASIPDTGGQRPTTSADVGVREEKPREEKPREETLSAPTARPSAADPASSEEPDPPAEPWRPLLNLIGKLEGEPDEKAAWLDAEFPLIQAEAEADPNPNRLKPIAIRFYRSYLKGDRKFKGWAAKQETRRVMAEHDAKFAASMRALEEDEGVEAAHR